MLRVAVEKLTPSFTMRLPSALKGRANVAVVDLRESLFGCPVKFEFEDIDCGCCAHSEASASAACPVFRACGVAHKHEHEVEDVVIVKLDVA